MAWLFKRRRNATDELIGAIINGELKRRETDALVEQKRLEHELRKLELEGQQLEARGEEQRRDRADREKLRQERQQHAARIREIRAERKRTASAQPADAHPGDCKVCVNPSDPSLTERDITWHHNGHREGPSIWAN